MTIAIADILHARRLNEGHADEISLADLKIQLNRLQGLIEAISPSSTNQHGRIVLTPHQKYQAAKGIYTARRKRGKYFKSALMGEPAWDILLDLYICEAEGRRVSITDACIGSCVPPTTGLRWIQVLSDEKLLKKVEDPTDARRAFVSLTDHGTKAMDKFLEDSVE